MKSPRMTRLGQLALTGALLALLSGCEESPSAPPPSQAPSIIEFPKTGKDGSTVEYRAEISQLRETKMSPYGGQFAKEGAMDFGLTLTAQRLPDGRWMLEGKIPYVVIAEAVGPLMFTLDTREPVAEMDDTADLELQLVHPGLKSPDHPLNDTLNVLKTLTRQSFQIRLKPDGSFDSLHNYPRLEQLDPSLKKLKTDKRADREQYVAELLDVLTPQDAELMFCLLFPSREQRLVGNTANWQGTCPLKGEMRPMPFDATGVMDSAHATVRYHTREGRQDGEHYYGFSYSATLSDWMEMADFNLNRSVSTSSELRGAGKTITTHSRRSGVQLRRMAEPAQTPPAEQP
ncbi:hypothetical protein [Pseudomonas purpurea]|uniref:hypothetical protein n=1 Tax=Pseudomonas purpurea TaxID=3136737 RepID=UPI0032633C9B